jgi:hypothetical protein
MRALQDQFGLKLESRKAQFEGSADRAPVAN